MLPQKTAIILGVTADIGRGLAERLLGDGWHVIGVGRTLDRVQDLSDAGKLQLYQCDIAAKESVRDLVSILRNKEVTWDLLLSSVGTMEPIGRFFDLDFDEWKRSVTINFIAQMRALQAL